MPRANQLPRVHRYSIEFKLTAVKLSKLQGVQIHHVAQALDIHPFMLSRWRKHGVDFAPRRVVAARQSIVIVMRFRKDFLPREDVLRRVALERGYELASGSIAIECHGGQPEWRFVAVALRKGLAATLSELAAELARFDGVENFSLSHARN